ncbi:hypothetical protein DSO57_1019436 [Entomophthora muscae]|uniref:Uncharacterized protein n=1 Tax=Entomophthora muscae TaxID=34485 RepID=A0ACC2S5X7_9FUNG|nr:hypothetical protein DSO57_1019436 [Entomophthora muscae]
MHNFQRLFLSGMAGSDENTEHGFVLAADSGCRCLTSSYPIIQSKITPPVELSENSVAQSHGIQSEEAPFPIPTQCYRHSTDDSPTRWRPRPKISTDGIMGGL